MTTPNQAEPSIVPIVRAAFRVANLPDQLAFASLRELDGTWRVVAVSLSKLALSEAPGLRIVTCPADTKLGDKMELPRG